MDIIYERYWIHNKKSDIYTCAHGFQPMYFYSNVALHCRLQMYLYHIGHFYPADKRRRNEKQCSKLRFQLQSTSCMCFQEVGNGFTAGCLCTSLFSSRLVPIYLSGVCSYLTPVDDVLHRSSSRGLGNIHVDSVLKENIQ